MFSYRAGLEYEIINFTNIDNNHIVKYNVNNWIMSIDTDYKKDNYKYAIFSQGAVSENLFNIIGVRKPTWISSGIKARDLTIIKNYHSTLNFKNNIPNSGKVNITIGCAKLKEEVTCQISCPLEISGKIITKYNTSYWKLIST